MHPGGIDEEIFFGSVLLRIIVDLDGTICSEERQFSRSLAKPLRGAVESLQELVDRGHTVIIYSARTWAEYEMTVDWLNQHKVPFSQLVLGKPEGDVWIDDRAIGHQDWPETMMRLS